MKEFKAESKKLLDLVVNSIYTNREIFLRELISNASDALDKRRFMALTDSGLSADYAIDVTVDKTARTLTIADNGVGMNEQELEDNLGTIAASGTEKFKKTLGDTDDNALIGQFGVGFYSAFMVADRVTVISRRVGSEQAYTWESDGESGFEITKSFRPDYGTSVTLHLKEDGDENYSQYLEYYQIAALVKKYSNYVRFPIRCEKPKAENDGVTVGELDVLNSIEPIWKKQKSELTDESVNEFYKNTYRDFNDPLLTITARIEGAVDYTAMLFVPSEPSYDFYTKDYKRGLQLYCNGVMIMDKCADLIPEYLGFMHGVVDTADLSLNVSRETFQEDRRVRAIANGLEKKILSEFNKLLNSDREKYEKLFNAFAKAIKYGAYDNYGANKDKLKDLLLYYSDSEKKLVTFKEFTQKLGEGEPIYYACGETVDKIAMQPQLEGMRSSGKDVLYFTDPVDEFVARMLESYDDHKFENVANTVSDDKSNENVDKAFVERIEKSLNGRASVVGTDKLKSYPVCLAAKGDVSLEMERVINAMGGANGMGLKAQRVLQVNFAHPVIEKLKTLEGGAFDDLVTVLYNEALLAEGYKTENEFLSTLNRVLETAIVTNGENTEKVSSAKKSTTGTKKSTAKSTTAKKSSGSKSGSASKKSTKSESDKNENVTTESKSVPDGENVDNA